MEKKPNQTALISSVVSLADLLVLFVVVKFKSKTEDTVYDKKVRALLRFLIPNPYEMGMSVQNMMTVMRKWTIVDYHNFIKKLTSFLQPHMANPRLSSIKIRIENLSHMTTICNQYLKLQGDKSVKMCDKMKICVESIQNGHEAQKVGPATKRKREPDVSSSLYIDLPNEVSVNPIGDKSPRTSCAETLMALMGKKKSRK